MNEAAIQKQIRNYLAAVAIDAVHAANGAVLAGDSKARAIQMNKLKAAGVIPGFPDLILFDRRARRVAFLEVKAAKGKQTPSQEKFEREYIPLWGWPYAVVRSTEDVAHCLNDWGWR